MENGDPPTRDGASATHRPPPAEASAPERGGTDVHLAVKVPSPSGVPCFTAVAGPGAGRSFAMTTERATAGRHATNDLVLVDPRVSAVHLELRRHGDRVHVRDTGSTNGTWLGPHRVSEIELAAGGEVIVGDTRLRLDMDGGAEPAPTSPDESFGDLVGGSTAMRELFATLARVAPKDIGLLIQGETGTGKEEVARALHWRSPRAGKPFVVIDATSLPETLAESLLFGHEKGAFTGATERRIGLFEAAHQGTIFLDEIGELPAPLQAKFLRVLERREFSRVGGTAPISVDVRVIAATHRDLRHEIDAGRFREDLYFRLAQLRVHIAPLRDRLEDIPIALSQAHRVDLRGARDPHRARGRRTPVDAALARERPRAPRNVLSARAAALCSNDLIRRADVLEGKGRDSAGRARSGRRSIFRGRLRRRRSGRCSGSRRRTLPP